jgi:hypothetical protein
MNQSTMIALRISALLDKRDIHRRFSQGCKRAGEHKQLAAQCQKEAERLADMLTQAPRRQERLPYADN